MEPLRFKEFLDSQESSAFTRSRHMWLLGLGPDMAPQAIFSRSTADPREVEYKKKKKKKKKKSKKKKKKIKEALEEGKTQPPVNKEVDKWLEAVDKLKRDLDGFWDDEEDDEDKPKPEDLEFNPEEDEGEEEDDFRDLEVGDEEQELTPPEEEPGEEDEINELPPPPPFEPPKVQPPNIPPKFKEWKLRREGAAELGHMGLDAVGLIPGLGEGADFANAAWYMAEAEKSKGREKQWKYFLAAMSIISMIPEIGDAIGKGVKYLAKSNRHFAQFSFKFGPTVKKYWPKVLQFVQNNDKLKNRAMELDLAVRSLI